tara:strand:+ start:229 stop:927 length:699 start_codon:yes stop_codon:yes gene_type:complete
MRYAIFLVGQKRSIIDIRMKLKLKEALKYFNGDIFFVLEEDECKLDLSMFYAKEIIYYKYYRPDKISILMSYGWSKCMDLIEKYEKINNYKYDIIYKTRPDLLLRNYIPNELKIDKNILEKKIVWGETIGMYGTDISDPKYAIKDTFNIITRNACKDFFIGFHTFSLNYHGKFLGNEALLGLFLFKQNIEKKVVKCNRTIIRMKNQETSHGAKSLNDKIEDIKINDEIYIIS